MINHRCITLFLYYQSLYKTDIWPHTLPPQIESIDHVAKVSQFIILPATNGTASFVEIIILENPERFLYNRFKITDIISLDLSENIGGHITQKIIF